MKTRALATLSILVLMQSAQAQVTVKAMQPTSWQTGTVTTTSSSVSTTPVNFVIKAPEERTASLESTPTQPTIKIQIASPAVYKSDSTECTSWQCASNNVSNSASQQILVLEKNLSAASLPTDTSTLIQDSNVTNRVPMTQTREALPSSAPENTVAGVLKSKLSYADKLMRLIHIGRRFGKNACGTGLRNIFEAAGIFKRGIARSNSTKLWDPYLVKQGFKNMGKNSPFCKIPGTIRLYNGTQIKVRKKTMGDIHGHVEFVGTDGRFHSSRSSNTSRDTQVAKGRRPLIGCYVKTSEVES